MDSKIVSVVEDYFKENKIDKISTADLKAINSKLTSMHLPNIKMKDLKELSTTLEAMKGVKVPSCIIA